MTSLSATQFDLTGRGTVAEGHFADLVVFNPDKVIDTATFERPIQAPAGIAHVFVDGREVWRKGQSTGARPGCALRNGQAAA